MRKRIAVFGSLIVLVVVIVVGVFVFIPPMVWAQTGGKDVAKEQGQGGMDNVGGSKQGEGKGNGGKAEGTATATAIACGTGIKKDGKCEDFGPVKIGGRKNPTPVPTATPKPKPTPTAGNEVVPVPTTPPANGGGQPPVSGGGQGGSLETQLAQQLLQKINQDRASMGLPPYAWNAQIAVVAYEHSRKIGAAGQLSHQLPGEPDPCTRVRNAGINWRTCGENAGMAGAFSDKWGPLLNVHNMMMAEKPPQDGHRKNLLSQSFKKVGIGVFIDGKGTVWVTEDFIG